MKSSILILITIFLSALYSSVDAVKETTGNDVCKFSKKKLFDGTQNPNGECVTTVMGEIPSKDKMVSTLILFPENGGVVKPNVPFTIRTKSINLKAGFFDDPATQYYLFPQTLDGNGLIQGHSHVTVQKLNGNNVPDPQIFAFFKGLNDAADGNGELSVLVEKGLPAGQYRLCTMTASFGHQPTLMPVAQRGSQDDCVRFTSTGNRKRNYRKKRNTYYKV